MNGHLQTRSESVLAQAIEQKWRGVGLGIYFIDRMRNERKKRQKKKIKRKKLGSLLGRGGVKSFERNF